MKIIATILEKTRPLFEEGGKLSRAHCIFQAGDAALFGSRDRTRNAPFGREALDVKRYMSMVIMALVPSLVAAVYFYGWRVLLMVLVSYVAGGIVEVLFAMVRKEEIYEGFLVTGFIFPLILPPATPLWLVAVGIVFGTLIGKEIFGGTGRNLFNAALVGRCFLALSYPSVMAEAWVAPARGGLGQLFAPGSLFGTEAITSATPLVLAKGGELAPTFDLFFGRVVGSAGETSALVILAGGIFLVLSGVASWRTVVSTLVSFIGMAWILQAVSPATASPVHFHLLAGGILFGAFFMATDPVTSPVTCAGKWVYGAIIGITTMLIRSFSGYVEGVTFAILLGNICAPLIDHAVIQAKVRRYAREG